MYALPADSARRSPLRKFSVRVSPEETRLCERWRAVIDAHLTDTERRLDDCRQKFLESRKLARETLFRYGVPSLTRLHDQNALVCLREYRALRRHRTALRAELSLCQDAAAGKLLGYRKGR